MTFHVQSRRPSRTLRWLWILVLLGGIFLRLWGVERPLDNRLTSPWRESDGTQIARNFHREGMNILYPRVDWRGNTPGYVEMEFPILPWSAAMLYQVFGEHVQLYRMLTAVLQIACLLLFALLAIRALPPPGALLSTALYAFNQTLIELATTLQPEPLMLFFLLVAVHLLWRWDDSEGDQFTLLFGASAATGAAILAKATGAHIGLLIAFVVLRKLGSRAFKEVRVYAAAALALVPGILWYGWARQFWEVNGLSLGLSNESHFFGLDMLWPPTFLAGIVKLETSRVFTPLGWLLAIAALREWRRFRFAFAWYAAVFVYYLISARTSADGWAYYYHSMAVAPASLLMGFGFTLLSNWTSREGGMSRFSYQLKKLALPLAGLTLVALMALGVRATLHQRERWRTDLFDLYVCTRQFEPLVPRDEQIVVPGGTRFDEYGTPVAYNRPMVFSWMDRRGFSYAAEDLSVETIDGLAAMGGRFWMVHGTDLGTLVGEAALDHYIELDRCDRGYVLLELP